MRKNSALIIVDLQRDFCPGGALAVPGGDLIVPVINRYLALFAGAGRPARPAGPARPVYATRDLHPKETVHFSGFGGDWPTHCVKGTSGADFHPELSLPEGVVVITKGEDPKEDAYSAFDGHDPDGRRLDRCLRDAGITQLYIGGLATDYCVRATVLDAVDRGFKVAVLEDAVSGVELKDGDSARALNEMSSAGASVITIEALTSK